MEVGGTYIRVEEEAESMPAAVDLAVEKLSRQLDRFKSKRRASLHVRKERRQIRADKQLDIKEIDEDARGSIKRRKTFELLPMTEDEAVEQMELLDHDFFVFLNKETRKTEVVYRRREGAYGQLVPQVRRK
jgi:putative sigma-54 modulation protein